MRASNNSPRRPRNWYYYATKLGTIFVCSCVVKISRLVDVMLHSRNIIAPVMRASYLCYMVFFALWMYTSFYVQPRHPNWNETHKLLVYGATGAATAGGILWTMAIWPVFHIWTIPLGIVLLVLFLDVVSLLTWEPRRIRN